jgi:hypothetical protein
MNGSSSTVFSKRVDVGKNYQSGLRWTRFLIYRMWIRALLVEEANKIPNLGEGTLFLIYERTVGEDFLSNRLLLDTFF